MSDAARADVDPEMLTMIRGMLAEEDTKARLDAKPASNRFAPVHDPDAPEFVERRKDRQPHLEAYTEPRRRLRLPTLGGWRPSRRTLITAAFLAVLVFRPLWIVAALLFLVFSTMGLFVLFGSDRVWGGFVLGLRRYIDRRPERGPRVAARLDRFAERWDRVLDRFPDGTVDALYFPDLQGLMEADARHDAAVADRLDRMREQA